MYFEAAARVRGGWVTLPESLCPSRCARIGHRSFCRSVGGFVMWSGSGAGNGARFKVSGASVRGDFSDRTDAKLFASASRFVSVPIPYKSRSVAKIDVCW